MKNSLKTMGLLGVAALAAACGTAAPTTAADAGADALAATDAPRADVAPPGDVPRPVCGPRATDYQPRTGATQRPLWSTCRSDSNRFQPFTPDQISSIRRSADFDLINANPEPIRDARGNVVAPAHPMPLFDPNRDPSTQEFTAVAAYYASAAVESGLVERFARRPDEHYPQPAGAVINAATDEYDDRWCGMESNWMAARDYCVGPASLRPVMNAALAAGAMGTPGAPSRVYAARMEASLLYLIWASVYKESLSCLQDVSDCDSAWGYYTVGVERDGAAQQALARYVRALDVETHQRIWDGLLAVHCWREIDGGLQAMPPVAADRALRERAREQLDRALNRALAVIVNSRLRGIATALGETDTARRAAALSHQAFLGVVGPLLARALETWVPTRYAATVASAGPASVTAAITALRATTLDAPTATRTAATLDAIFSCP